MTSESSSVNKDSIFQVAFEYIRSGLSVIPIRTDGSKSPAIPTWKPFQDRLPNVGELRSFFFQKHVGIAIICGKVSGNLEVLDFDQNEVFDRFWLQLGEESWALPPKLSVVKTPRGRHLLYRCSQIGPNQRLAEVMGDSAKIHTVIESRGQGGYVLTSGCPLECHPLRLPYTHVGGPPLTAIQEISVEERELLFDLARSFGEAMKVGGSPEPLSSPGEPLRPGDDFNRRATWESILEPAGWTRLRESQGLVHWRRPGKAEGMSATTGMRSECGKDLLYVFTSNGAPLESCRSYTKFAACAVLHYSGDFAEAARRLLPQGFGSPSKTKPASAVPPIPAEPQREELEIPVPEPEPWPDPPSSEAFCGLAGEMVRLIDPDTEADPIGVLVQMLVIFGNIIGRQAFWRVEEDQHFGNLYCCLVGPTGEGRKGVSMGRALKAFEGIDEDWSQKCAASGVSSGEGLLWAVRDPIHKDEPIKVKGIVNGYQDVIVDQGQEDKRLLVTETEFASVLRVMSRDGNTVGARIRDLWDIGRGRSLVKNSPFMATNAHVSIVGHITKAELIVSMDEVAALNGFANRFIWLGVRRSKIKPFGGEPTDFGDLAYQMRDAVNFGKVAGEITLTQDAREYFSQEAYPYLTGRSTPGIQGSIMSRGAAQVRRLAMLYALIDMRDEVSAVHLRAAMAVWNYCERSIAWIWGNGTGDTLADDILALLLDAKGKFIKGVTQSEIANHFGRHASASSLRKAMGVLRAANRIESEKVETGGRPTTIWMAK